MTIITGAGPYSPSSIYSQNTNRPATMANADAGSASTAGSTAATGNTKSLADVVAAAANSAGLDFATVGQNARTVLDAGIAAYGQTPAAIARGQEIAERACGGCHAIAGRPGSTVQGTAAPSFGAIAGRPNQTSQRLQSFIMTPHRPMPGMSLSLADVNDVVAYLLSLK